MVEVAQKVVKRTVILLGEGNFSYALARLRLHLAKTMTNPSTAAPGIHMVASSFDSETELFTKYPESVQILQKMH